MTGILLSQLSADNQEEPEKTTEEIEKEQLKAAYALNLCTVSVSQIIDYNDIYFLEREYDAILNNLNLEKMPKDEALLRILKQLLDVITFFRIQEGERKMMEKEYAQKIKNAIWSAVPNPAVLVTGGNPAMIVASLVSQVGIGYMNYRKEKAHINQEKERKEWELQRSAMEQFNGLRRELFDTAWRLADEYDFPDEYRITISYLTSMICADMKGLNIFRKNLKHILRSCITSVTPQALFITIANTRKKYGKNIKRRQLNTLINSLKPQKKTYSEKTSLWHPAPLKSLL